MSVWQLLALVGGVPPRFKFTRSDGVTAGDDFLKIRELGRRYEAVEMLFAAGGLASGM